MAHPILGTFKKDFYVTQKYGLTDFAKSSVGKIAYKNFPGGIHPGIDLGTKGINLPAISTCDGVVVQAGKNGGWGNAERIFFDKYINWLLSDQPGGGMATYPSEVRFYAFLKESYFYVDKNGVMQNDGRTWADWLFDKMAR